LLPADLLDRYRREFPITDSHVFLNHAGVAPSSTRVAGEVHRWMHQLAHLGRPSFEEWEAEAQLCRERFARLIGADPAEIAFVRNTSHGLSLIASGMDWRPGDRVAVATAVEYPSNVYPWEDLRRRGVVALDPIEAHEGAVGVEAVGAALRPRTRVVAISSAQYGSGAVTDLEGLGRLCGERGVLLCVDGIQTVGVLPLDVKRAGVHALAADSHKWMLGVMGIGALFIDRSVLGDVRPVLLGWRSMVDGWDFDRARFELLPDAGRYEEGSLPYPLIAGFAAALDLLHEVGVERIADHVAALVQHLAEGLEAMGCDVGPPPPYRRHIVTLRHRDVDSHEIEERLARAAIVASVRRGAVRLSPHFYNTPAEMDTVLAEVRELLQGR
jgi:selenocysteine lyase/cysteine desulfurase